MLWEPLWHRACETARSRHPGSAVLHDLKDRCIDGSGWGGDPESCTACVAMAELVMLAGVPPSPGLPSWWFDGELRHVDWVRAPEPFDGSMGLCESPFYLAMQWCSDAPRGRSDRRTDAQFSRVLASGPRVQRPCPGSQPLSSWLQVRHARPLLEVPSEPGPQLYPMFAVYDDDETLVSSPESCTGESSPYSSLRSYQQQYNVQPLPSTSCATSSTPTPRSRAAASRSAYSTPIAPAVSCARCWAPPPFHPGCC
jgi:hypothetical protein